MMLSLLLAFTMSHTWAKKTIREEQVACYREIVEANLKFQTKYSSNDIHRYANSNAVKKSGDKNYYWKPLPQNLDESFLTEFKKGIVHFEPPVFQADKDGFITEVIKDKNGNCLLAKTYEGATHKITKTVGIAEKSKKVQSSPDLVKKEIEVSHCQRRLMKPLKSTAKLTFYEGDRTREIVFEPAYMLIDEAFEFPKAPSVYYRFKAKIPGMGPENYYELHYNSRKNEHSIRPVIPSKAMLDAIKNGEKVFQEVELSDKMTEETDREMGMGMSYAMLYFKHAVLYSHASPERYKNDQRLIESVLKSCQSMIGAPVQGMAEFVMVYQDIEALLKVDQSSNKEKIQTKAN
ncbi:MAG: hypothetical protein JNM93_13025 [Bacteriovoracaceae bacterium]|nr:hypothetical protein [Bacteriovoracaceae bacterium]